MKVQRLAVTLTKKVSFVCVFKVVYTHNVINNHRCTDAHCSMYADLSISHLFCTPLLFPWTIQFDLAVHEDLLPVSLFMVTFKNKERNRVKFIKGHLSQFYQIFG